MRNNHLITLFFGLMPLMACVCSCQQTQSSNNKKPDVLLAEVYNEKLLLSEVRPLLIDASDADDSASQVRTHVESWVREILLLHEAERNVPVDVNINKLVQDYRASLLISNYENVLVNTLLDTVVTEAELQAYYARNRNQYLLETPIMRCYFVKLRKPVQQKEMFHKLWQSKRPGDLGALLAYCQSHAADYLLQDSTWYRQPEIEQLMPAGSLSKQNLNPGKVIRLSDAEYDYHLKVLQRLVTNEIAPLSYVGEQARRYILHKRKIDLLEKIKSDIYAREIDGDNVKIHI